MKRTFDVAVIVGSLRKGSFSRKVAAALIERAPKGVTPRFVEIGDLSVYNQDLDDKSPAPWRRFRKEVASHDAVLFVTPEYNRSIPGCLKNALDIGSRPEGKSIWSGLPAGVVSVTPYKLGAFGANHALRQTFVFLDMPVMQQPEAYIGSVGDLFDRNGKVANKDTDKFLRTFMEKFSAWTRKVARESSDRDFDAFLEERKKAASAYVKGNAEPLDVMTTSEDPATFFHPMGATVKGAAAVKKRYDDDAKAFGRGGTSRIEILQSDSSGDFGFWTGLQHADAQLGGKRVPMTLRITEVFRFERGWKLVHRHAESMGKKSD
jgi:NAD(P)H-dependent FMN reductase/ketosteroid isomerase-like protein